MGEDVLRRGGGAAEPLAATNAHIFPLKSRFATRGRKARLPCFSLGSPLRPSLNARSRQETRRLRPQGELRLARLPQGPGRFRAHHYAPACRRLRAIAPTSG